MNKRIPALLLSLFISATCVCADEDRPKIGLVLGGGGALGFAHIGVLKVLEEEQVPIDYIAGTSMGAIVAGMYASGMSPEEMERNFVELDWWQVLRDRSPHQYLVYRRKQENKRFMGTEFGLNSWKLMFSPGMSQGQKLNNVLETFSLNSAGISDFDQLNIPYRAVATDLRKGESVVLKHGSLAQSMRASMAVPGIFTPVRIGDRVYVDGGVLNNIPVNVVKEMGADIIIAVDVGATAAEKSANEDFYSLGDVVGRTYSLMQRPNQEQQLKQADLIIEPDMSTLSASHFHKAETIISRGEQTAAAMNQQIALYSNPDAFRVFHHKQQLKHDQQIVIKEIKIEDNNAVSEQSIRYRIKSDPGNLHVDEIYQDLLRIYGMGYFETVTYDLEPEGNEYALIYQTHEKFWGPGFLHLGLKIESGTDRSMIWSLLLNYTRTQLNPLGGEFRMELEGGGQRRILDAEWYQPFSKSGRHFFASSLKLLDEEIDLYNENDLFAVVDQQEIYGHLDLGISGFEYGEFRIGLLGGYAWDEGQSGTILLPKIDEPIVGFTTRFVLDQLDDPVFPSKGYKVALEGLFADQDLGSGRSFDRLEASTLLPLTVGRHTLLPRISGGSSLGTQLPFYSTFHLGGMDNFAGYAPYQLFGNYYALLNLGYLYRIGRLPPTMGNGIYALARLDAGNAWDESSDVSLSDLKYGALAGLGADTAIGRCILSIGKAQDLSGIRIYFSIGNKF